MSAAQPTGGAVRAQPALLSTAAFAGMFVFGIVMALLGAILPSLSSRLAFRLSDIGTLFFAMNLTMLVTSLLLGLLMDRFGMKPPMAVGPLLVGTALALIARASEFGAILPAAVLLGAGGGALNGATNTLVADLHDDPRRKSSALNLLGVFFGFGALLMPFAIGALLALLGIDALLWSAAALALAAGVFAASLRFPPPKQRERLPLQEVARFARTPFVAALAFLLFFQSGAEFTLGGYITSLLTRDLAMEVASASWVLAGYWAALMIARVVLSRIVLGVEPSRVVLVSALASCILALGIALAPGLGTAALAVVATGFAISGIYPTVLGIAGSRYGAHSGTVFGILFTVALSGGMTLPWLAGQLAEGAGTRWVFALVAGSFAAIAALILAALRAGTR